VPAYAGRQPLTLAWLWQLESEHRLPLPRLVLVALERATRDFRAPIWLDLAAYAVLAALLVLAARRMRGRSAWTDATFPLTLLHVGHLAFRSGFEIVFVLPVILWSIALGCALTLSEENAPVRAAVLGATAAGLPLSGAQGLVLSVPIALLALALAARHRRGRLVACAGALVGLAVGVAYLVGWHRDTAFPASRGILAILRPAVEVVTMAIGPAGRIAWPYSPFVLAPVGLLVLAALGAAWRRGPDRLAALASVTVLGAFGLVALAVGYGRSGIGPGAGLWPQYSTLAVGFVVAMGFVLVRFGAGRTGAIGRAALFALVCASLWPNTRFGVAEARRMRRESIAFENAAWLGASGAVVADLPPLESGALFGPFVEMLRDARLGPYGVPERERDRRLGPFYRSIDVFATTPDRVRSKGRIRVGSCLGVRALLLPTPGEIRFEGRRGGPWTARVALCSGVGARVEASAGAERLFAEELRPHGGAWLALGPRTAGSGEVVFSAVSPTSAPAVTGWAEIRAPPVADR
jgi:hypothetical protein